MTEGIGSSLATALAKAQGEMQNAVLNKENPYFSSRYADLASIRDATVPALSKHGLCIFHVVMRSGEEWIVRGILKHGESGESIISDFPVNATDKPQAVGSAITYAKRYTWAGLCGIAADEDDDANAAQGHKPADANRRAPVKTNVVELSPPPTLVSATPVALLRGEDEDWTSWGKRFLDHAKQAKTTVEADDWLVANKTTLDAMEKQVPKTHKRLSEAIFQIFSKLGTGETDA